MRVHIVRWSFYLRWCLFLVPISKSPIPLRVKKVFKSGATSLYKNVVGNDGFFKIYIYFFSLSWKRGNSAASKALRKIYLVAFYHEFYCPGFHHHLKDKKSENFKKVSVVFTLFTPYCFTYISWPLLEPNSTHCCAFLYILEWHQKYVRGYV